MSAETKEPTWKVYSYDAAVCIGTAEIARQMKDVYDKTKGAKITVKPTGPPAEGSSDPTPIMDNDTGKPITFDAFDDDFPSYWVAVDQDHGENPMWYMLAEELAAPKVAFNTLLTNGVNLLTIISQGKYFHQVPGKKIWVKEIHQWVCPVKYKQICLNQVEFSFQCKLAGVKHVAGKGETIDKDFTVQALYCDLEDPANIASTSTSTFVLTDAALEALTDKNNPEAAPQEVAVALEGLKNKPYQAEDTFWQHVVTALDKAKLDPSQYKTAIENAAKLQYSDYSSIQVQVTTELQQMIHSYSEKEEKAKKKAYVIGTSKIPPVKSTTGPFTPRAVAVTSYQDTEHVDVGTLNWNLLVAADANALPEADAEKRLNELITAKGGTFLENPTVLTPNGAPVPGVVLLSYGKLIEDVILPKGFESIGLTADKWSCNVDPNFNKAVLTQNVSVDLRDEDGQRDENVDSAEFTTSTTIEPDPTNDKIAVAFELDVKLKKDWAKSLVPDLGLSWIAALDNPKYVATWNGSFTFGLQDGKLTMSYSQDTPTLKVRSQSTAWRVIGDIVTLGLNEAFNAVDKSLTNDLVDDLATGLQTDVLGNVLKSVEFPGEAVFEFSDVDLCPLGVRAHLQYKATPDS